MIIYLPVSSHQGTVGVHSLQILPAAGLPCISLYSGCQMLHPCVDRWVCSPLWLFLVCRPGVLPPDENKPPKNQSICPDTLSAWHSWYFYFRLSLTAVFQGSNLKSQQGFSPWWEKKISSNTRLLLVVFNPRVDTALCQYVIPQREKCTSTCVCRFPWLLPNLKQKPTERASSYKNSHKRYIWKALAMQIWKWKK